MASAIGTISVDIYMITPGQVIDGITPTFTFIPVHQHQHLRKFSSGQYQLILTVAGTKTIVYDSGPLTFADQTATDLIIYSRGSETLPNVLLNDSDGAGQQVIANNKLARIKVVNGAFQSGTVNQLLNGNAGGCPTWPMRRRRLTTIIPAGAGHRDLRGHRNARRADCVAGQHVPGGDRPDRLRDRLCRRDDRSGAQRQQPAARFRYPRPFVSSIHRPIPRRSTLYINDVRVARAMATNTASAYCQIVSNSYTFTFRNPATGAIVLTLARGGIGAGQTYSIYALGPAGALTGLVTRGHSVIAECRDRHCAAQQTGL